MREFVREPKRDDLGKEIIIDPDFERAKANQENKNKNKIYEGLASKFSELIKENPIIVYTQHDGFGSEQNNRFFDKVQEVRTDESGTGGSISVNFSYDDYIVVDKKGARGSYHFDKNFTHYKITKESLSNIMRMMNEMIRRSGYSDQEKAMMSQYVFDNFKGKIIKLEDLEKNEK